MFTASNFTYDGVYSEQYGLKIASLEANTLERTPYVSPTISTAKPTGIQRFSYQGMSYDTAPSYQFQVISEEPIDSLRQAEILSWIEGRKGYKKLIIHQNGLDEFYYKCIFTIQEIIYFAGHCIGFTVTANFDSPYMYGKPSTVTVTSNGAQEETITILNKTKIKEEYTSPIVEFTSTNYITSGSDNDVNVIITNQTDDTERHFLFKGAPLNNNTTVDNETKIITGTTGKDFLLYFPERKWLRLKPGRNTIKISINGQVKITCPHYEKIRF